MENQRSGMSAVSPGVPTTGTASAASVSNKSQNQHAADAKVKRRSRLEQDFEKEF